MCFYETPYIGISSYIGGIYTP